jgi:PAS domain S-box-containing protein
MATLRTSGARRLGLLLHQASEAIFVVDAGRRLVYVNPSWEALTGFEADEVLGLECRPAGPSAEPGRDGLAASFCPPAEAFGAELTRTTTLVVHTSGERRWRRLEFWPLHTREERPLGVIGVVRPVESATGSSDAPSLRLRNELLSLRERMRAANQPVELIGTGPRHVRLLEQIEAAAALVSPVLIVGDRGTGKRRVARAIHERGPHASSPLVVLDVPALPPEPLEAEVLTLLGRPESADGRVDATPTADRPATAVIREVLELPRDIQARLVALHAPRRAPELPRLLATTSFDPEQARLDDRLRDDLYFLLTSLVIRLDPLRDRLEDLPLLTQAFLEQASQGSTRKPLGFAPEAIEVLRAYDWPGNLRELRKVVEACVAQASGDQVTAADLPPGIRGHLAAAYNPPPVPPPVTPLDASLELVERRLIEQALTFSRHNKSKAAELLVISRPRLYRRMKELNIPDLPEHDEPSGTLAQS